MHEFSSRLRELQELAEKCPEFYEVEITFCIRLQEGSESYYLRLASDSDSISTPRQGQLNPNSGQVHWF